jgi:hypothetical protein
MSTLDNWLPSWFAFKILATMLVLIVVACVFVEDERGSYNA